MTQKINATINPATADWKSDMNCRLANLVGRDIGVENIHSDALGWYYYVAANSLVEKHPLILNHYRGPLFVIIPVSDYQELEAGIISPEEYIEASYWNFGYFWVGNSSAFWQPLEDITGIHDTEKISRYLQILSCRTHFNSSGCRPRVEQCENCSVANCPLAATCRREPADWAGEVEEHDYREELFSALQKRAKEELQVELLSYHANKGSENCVLLEPGLRKDECYCSIPVKILNDILYHPGERDWDAIAKSLTFELGVLGRPDRLVIGDELSCSPAEFCRNFWGSFGIIDAWNKTEPKPKQSWFTRLKNWFRH